LSLSATKRLPAASMARPDGLVICAEVASPPSPEYPTRELPAARVRAPFPSSLYTQLPALKYVLPAASATTD
jgi:hypothetical protein